MMFRVWACRRKRGVLTERTKLILDRTLDSKSERKIKEADYNQGDSSMKKKRGNN